MSVALELSVMGVGAAYWAREGRVVQTTIFGKTKMVLLSVGLSLFLLGRVLGAETAVNVAVWLFWAALVFAFASGIKLVVPRRY